MYAIIATGGKQYRVSEGDEVFVEKLQGEAGDKVEFETLAVVDDAGLHLGDELAQAKVTGEIVKQGKHKKVLVMKYKAKKNYRRKNGHRQPYTRVRIEAVSL